MGITIGTPSGIGFTLLIILPSQAKAFEPPYQTALTLTPATPIDRQPQKGIGGNAAKIWG
jgi:hypothetical protein